VLAPRWRFCVVGKNISFCVVVWCLIMNTDLLGPLFRVRLVDWLSVIRNTLDSCKPDGLRGRKLSSFVLPRKALESLLGLRACRHIVVPHEIIAVAEFNGADNLCAGFTSASLRRLIFTPWWSKGGGLSRYGPYPGASQVIWLLLGRVKRHANFGLHLVCNLF
jgi:hypothetical protein